MKTTLNNIRKHSPCPEGWIKLLKSLNKTQSDDEPLEMLTILESNSLEDAMWCLNSIECVDKEVRLFAVFCARQVQHLNNTTSVNAAIDVAERFAFGEATKEELDAVRAAVRADLVYYAANYSVSAVSAYYYAAFVAYYATFANHYEAAHSAAYYATIATAGAVREKQKQKFIEMFC